MTEDRAGANLQVLIESELSAGLDAFINQRDEPPRGRMTYHDAVNVIVRDWLMGQGFMPLPDDPDEITTALDAAQVPKG